MNNESTSLKPGTLLQGGKYRIVRFINSGGFGCTYEAEHTQMQSRVAIKEFFMADYCNRDERTGSVSLGTQSKRELVAKLRKKFVEEARSVFKMKHPHIVRVIDVFEENNTAYYAMDYVEGCSLQALVRQVGPLREMQALKYIREVADALRYVHSFNRLHLDVKPGNIMLDMEENAILIDFGASKHYDEETGENTSTLLGVSTKGYAPVEQMNRSFTTFSPATDIYALGATLYNTLTGITPPDASSLMSEELTLKPLPDTVSPQTRAAVYAAMQPKRKDRPQSIDEFLAILDGKTGKTEDGTTLDDDGPEVVVVNTPVSTKEEPKPKRKSLLSPITIGVACLVAIGIVVAAILLRKPKPHKGELALVDTVYVDTVAIPDRLTSEVVTPVEQSEEQNSPTQEEPEKGKVQQAAEAAQANQQQTQSEQPTQTTTTTQPSKPTGGYINGHEYVDLGLSVKWATCNVGASSPEGYGNYFAWGETSTKSEYWDSNSKTYEKSMGSIAGNSSYDAARSNWGGTWRMPTASEIDELINKCQRTWTTMGGHAGYKVTGPNGNSIFLPSAGYRGGTSLSNDGENGYFWSATPSEGYTQGAYDLDFGSGYFGRNWFRRYYGFSVRAVSE